jgi:hypothetical protein
VQDHPVERLLFGAHTSSFVSDDEGKQREKSRESREMSDFERFGMICNEWLEAVKEESSEEEEDN